MKSEVLMMIGLFSFMIGIPVQTLAETDPPVCSEAVAGDAETRLGEHGFFEVEALNRGVGA